MKRSEGCSEAHDVPSVLGADVCMEKNDAIGRNVAYSYGTTERYIPSARDNKLWIIDKSVSLVKSREKRVSDKELVTMKLFQLMSVTCSVNLENVRCNRNQFIS